MAKEFRISILFGLVILASLAAAGCGPKATVGGYRELLDYYQGEHIDKLVADWGAPKSSYVYADGRKEYLFLREYRQEYAGNVYPSIGFGYHRHWSSFGLGGIYYPQTVSTRYSFCETRAITDKKGKILEYYFRGDACRALPSTNQK